MNNTSIPSPDDLRKEISEFLKSKYGERVVVPPETDRDSTEPGGPDQKKTPPQINFDLKPSELESYLLNYVVGQNETVEVLATKICTHFNRMRLERSLGDEEELLGHIKSNILMLGPTGVGKTYLIKLIAQKIGVPFVKADATKFSETGYVGGDVEDLVRSLVHEADGDIKMAEYGIIYLDEIDKIASSGSVFGPDVSRTGVQRNLLKLMEESEVDLKTPNDLAAQMEAAMEAQRTGKVTRKKINTKNILFVMSGAFSGLADIIRRRMNQQPIGFRSNQENDDLSRVEEFELLKNVRSEDLLKYGFESEFIGRLPVVVTLNDLDVDGLYRILKNKQSSVILGKKRDFAAYQIKIDFSDGALKRIAELAYEEKTGARGLVSVTDRFLLKFEKMLPDTQITHFAASPEMVDNPGKELQKLLVNYYIKNFQRRFLASNGIIITFAPNAIPLILEKAADQGKNFEAYCNDLLRDYEYGLRLLNCEEFTVTKELVQEPKVTLEKLIKESYDKH